MHFSKIDTHILKILAQKQLGNFKFEQQYVNQNLGCQNNCYKYLSEGKPLLESPCVLFSC